MCARSLHLVRPAPLPRTGSTTDSASPADLGLACAMLALALVPLAGLLAGAPVGAGESGAATALALLSSRAAVGAARALWRGRA